MDFRQHLIPVINTCTLQGTLWDTGFPCTFSGGKKCSVDEDSAHIIAASTNLRPFLRSLISSVLLSKVDFVRLLQFKHINGILLPK